MPGWASLTEMLHRGKHHACSFQELHHIALMSARSSLLISRANPTTTNLANHVSLAATTHKVLLLYVQHQHDERTSQATGGLPVSQLVRYGPTWGRGRWWTENADEAEYVSLTIHTLLEAILGLEERLRATDSSSTTTHTTNTITTISSSLDGSSTSARGKGSSSGGSCTGVSSTRKSNTAGVDDCGSNKENSSRCTGEGCPDHDHSKMDPLSNQVGSLGVAEDCQEAGHYRSRMHQLQVISLLTLIQISLWVQRHGAMRKRVEDRKPGWWSRLAQICRRIGNPDLRAVVTSLLAESASPNSDLVISMTWEQYAVTHFHGRLLPGCSYLGCTHLGGVSEAAVCTKLCSGCRRSRYCSVQCQKAAWLAGGHSNVCRKR